jgi:hypothetical protein
MAHGAVPSQFSASSLSTTTSNHTQSQPWNRTTSEIPVPYDLACYLRTSVVLCFEPTIGTGLTSENLICWSANFLSQTRNDIFLVGRIQNATPNFDSGNKYLTWRTFSCFVCNVKFRQFGASFYTKASVALFELLDLKKISKYEGIRLGHRSELFWFDQEFIWDRHFYFLFKSKFRLHFRQLSEQLPRRHSDEHLLNHVGMGLW